MSNYIAPAIHPLTREIDKQAAWIDNHFGRHQYGVQFSDGRVFKGSDVRVPETSESQVMADQENG